MVTLRKQLPEAVANSVLAKILKSLIVFFNVGKSMNDDQLIETVKLINQQFYFLKLEDLKLCFDGMKMGKYIEGGKLFDRLDGQIILLALQLYTEERIALAETLNDEKHKETLEKPEEYVVAIGTKFFAANEKNEYFEVKHKDMAKRFGFGEAIQVKTFLINGDFKGKEELVKVKYANQAEIGSIKPVEAKKEKPTRKYDVMKAQIMADANLSPLQKENKLRSFAGLMPLTQEEYNQRYASK